MDLIGEIMKLEEYLSQTAGLYEDLARVTKDFRDSLLDAPVPGPPGELTWTFAHTPTEGQPSRRWLIGEGLPAIYGCRIMAEITPPSGPPPEKGVELFLVAPLKAGPESAPSNNLALALGKALPGGSGIKAVTGPGLAHDDKVRLEIPGKLLPEKVNLAGFVVNLRIPGLAFGDATLTYGGKTDQKSLGAKSAPFLKPPLAVMIGGPRFEFWPGCHVRITVTLFVERS